MWIDEISAGSVITVEGQKIAGTDTIEFLPEGCRILITKI